jgi:hypothetical protein
MDNSFELSMPNNDDGSIKLRLSGNKEMNQLKPQRPLNNENKIFEIEVTEKSVKTQFKDQDKDGLFK